MKDALSVLNSQTKQKTNDYLISSKEEFIRYVKSYEKLDQNDDWYATAALRHHEATRQGDAGALKFRLCHVECDPLALHTIETDFAPGAIGEGDTLSIGTFGPAEGAGPAAVALFGQLSGGAVSAAPPQMSTSVAPISTLVPSCRWYVPIRQSPVRSSDATALSAASANIAVATTATAMFISIFHEMLRASRIDSRFDRQPLGCTCLTIVILA